MSCDFYCLEALPQGDMGGLQCVVMAFPDHTYLCKCNRGGVSISTNDKIN